MSTGSIPSLTITPLPDRAAGISSKFASAGGASPYTMVAEGSVGFGDLLDVINPLQHLPIVGNIYRAVTGDESSVGAQLAGGTLYGGPLGGLISIASAVFGELFGMDAETTKTAENTDSISNKLVG
jgi:hypothetical protein